MELKPNGKPCEPFEYQVLCALITLEMVCISQRSTGVLQPCNNSWKLLATGWRAYNQINGQVRQRL